MKIKEKTSFCSSRAIWLSTGGVIVIWLLSIFIIPHCFQKWEERGQFGDMFGAVNALFSGLAFAGVIIAILLQRKELELQREELEQTRREFQRQTIEFEEQNKTLSIQRFENTFFNMLNLLTSIVNTISFKAVSYGAIGSFSAEALQHMIPPKRIAEKHGREVFTYFREELNPELKEIVFIEEFSEKVYDFFFKHPYNANNHIGHYFRVIYSILKLIEQNKNLSFKEKKSYSNILRAQLSNDELFLLFCNCVYRDDFLLFKLLIEKYSFLKHRYDFGLTDEIMNEYQLRAYQKDEEFDLHHNLHELADLGIENFISEES